MKDWTSASVLAAVAVACVLAFLPLPTFPVSTGGFAADIDAAVAQYRADIGDLAGVVADGLAKREGEPGRIEARNILPTIEAGAEKISAARRSRIAEAFRKHLPPPPSGLDADAQAKWDAENLPKIIAMARSLKVRR